MLAVAVVFAALFFKFGFLASDHEPSIRDSFTVFNLAFLRFSSAAFEYGFEIGFVDDMATFVP